MTRKAVSVLLVLLLIISSAVPSYCDDAIKKLGRGIANIATFPMEIPEQAKRVNQSDGPIAAMTWGFLRGIYMAAIRAVVGVYEVASFPVPYPHDYRPLLDDPEFFFSDMN